MLGWFFTPRFASHHSPFRERGEIFLKKDRTVNTTAASSADLQVEPGQEKNLEDIRQIADGIRGRLNTVLGDLAALDTQHEILRTSVLPLEQILHNKREEISKALDEAVQLNDKFPAEARSVIREAEGSVERLERIRKNLQKDLTEIVTDEKPQKGRGAYDRHTGKIHIDPLLAETDQESTLRHEMGHRLLHLFEEGGLLPASFYSNLRDALRAERDEASGQDFEELFAKVRASEDYQVYGDVDADVLTEELLNRYGDWKENRGTYANDEIALFRIIDRIQASPVYDFGKTDRPKNDDGKRYQAGPKPFYELQAEAAAGREAVENERVASKTKADEVANDQWEHETEQQAVQRDGGTKKERQAKRNLDERQKPDSIPQLAREVSQLRTYTQDVSRKISGVDGLIAKVVPANQREDFMYVWREDRSKIDDQLPRLLSWEHSLHTIDQWRKGAMKPTQFAMAIQQDLYPDQPEVMKEILSQYENMNWETMNMSSRMEQAKNLNIDLDEITDFIFLQMNKLRDGLKKLEENYAQLESVITKDAAIESTGIFTDLEFYSINHFVAGVKNVFNAFSEAWAQWSQLKEGKLSKTLGSLVRRLPFGDQAFISLEQNVDHKDDEVKDNFKKHLEHDYVSFDHLIPNANHPGESLMERTFEKKDGNRFRACLEYAADRGWLYDLDLTNQKVFGFPMLPGITVPGTWNDQKVTEYMKTLDDMNGNGETKETKRGYDRVDTKPDILPMIEVLDDEMDRRNYWAVKGIVDRAIKKGKEGEVSGWLMTRIMRRIRDDKNDAHKYFPKGVMDQLGNVGIGTPAWLTTFFKLDRHALEDFQQGRVKEFQDAGTLANTITLVEKRIKQLVSPNEAEILEKDTSRLDQLVAKVLASQTIGPKDGLNGYLSIYNEEFSIYRNTINETPTTLKVSDADDDFFNAKNGGSEVQLLGRDAFEEILKGSTTGAYNNPQKAKYFLDQLLHRYDNLKELGLPKELETYRIETEAKMNYMFQSAFVHNLTYQLPEHRSTRPGQELLLAGMLRRRLASPRMLLYCLSPGKQNSQMAQTLLKQIGQEYSMDEPGKPILHEGHLREMIDMAAGIKRPDLRDSESYSKTDVKEIMRKIAEFDLVGIKKNNIQEAVRYGIAQGVFEPGFDPYAKK